MDTAPRITKLPELHAGTLDTVMAERLAASENSVTSIPMLWQGLLEINVQVGKETRTAKLYIPKSTPQGTTFVLLNIPEGKEAVSFLHESGWIDCANQYRLPVFAAEPGNGVWGSPAQEQPYINACVQALFAGIYLRAGMSIYVVGYGGIGKCLHRYAMNAPLRVAAAVFMDASALEDAVIAEAEESSLDGTGMTLGHPGKSFSMTFDIPGRDIPVPVWILEHPLTAQAKKTAAHWLHAAEGALSAEDPVLARSMCRPGKASVLRMAPLLWSA